MPQISLYVQDSLARKLITTAKAHNYSVSKYVATVLAAKLAEDENNEADRRLAYRQLAGAIQGELIEPDEIPWESNVPRRFDLL